jgi:CRP-like cAMP-binding protein
LLRLADQAGRKIDGGVLIDQPLSRQDLAALTGTTLYSVSRVISEWTQMGILDSGRERVVIVQRETLAAIAEDVHKLPEAPTID